MTGRAASASLPGLARTVVDALPETGRQLSAAITHRQERALAAGIRPAPTGRPAAVLVLLGALPDGDATVVLLERATGLRSHPGQVAFPGGSLDAGDAGDVVAAALREAREEVGAPGAGVRVLGVLPAVPVPPRLVPVTPVLAWEESPTPLVVGDPGEVAAALRVRLGHLAAPGNRHQVRTSAGWVGPAFTVGDLTVWGFTGLVLDCLLRATGIERTWDRELIRDVPTRFGGPA